MQAEAAEAVELARLLLEMNKRKRKKRKRKKEEEETSSNFFSSILSFGSTAGTCSCVSLRGRSSS